MLHFTSYANQKFDILNKHNVFIIKEQVEEAVSAPEKLEKRGKYYFACKDRVKVVYKKEEGVIRVITFYPVK